MTQLSQLQSEYDSLSENDVEVVYIGPMGLDRVAEYTAKSKVRQEDLKFSNVGDPDRTFISAYQIEKPGQKFPEAYPSSFLIDKKGILRFKYIGMVPSDRPPISHLIEIAQMIDTE